MEKRIDGNLKTGNRLIPPPHISNIERLAACHNACKETSRIFLSVDEYQKSIVDIFTKYAGQKSRYFKFKTFQLINYRTKNVRKELQHKGLLMPVRASSFGLIKRMLEKPFLCFLIPNILSCRLGSHCHRFIFNGLVRQAHRAIL